MKKGWFWFCPIYYDFGTKELGPRHWSLSWLFNFVLFLHHSMLFAASIINTDVDPVYPLKFRKEEQTKETNEEDKMGKESEKAISIDYNSCDDEYTRSMEFLSRIFLTGDNGEQLTIKSTEGAESGKESLEITTGNDNQRWLFKVTCEEL